MFTRSQTRVVVLAALALSMFVPAAPAQDAPVKKDVPYVPTPQPVVDKMLEMAQVKDGDVVYDLGCGDGRIIVTAAKQHGAKGIGVDIDPERIKECHENAKAAGVEDKVKFIQQDLFTMEFKDANVLAMYLLPSVNVKLRPKILSDMKPGSRVVSHSFDMDDWQPDDVQEVESSTIYYWVVPAKVEGKWDASFGNEKGTLDLKQQYQNVTGTAKIGDKQVELKDAKLKGDTLTFSIDDKKYSAKVDGPKMSGDGLSATKS
jgi:SAM-dependent methyltransferase